MTEEKIRKGLLMRSARPRRIMPERQVHRSKARRTSMKRLAVLTAAVSAAVMATAVAANGRPSPVSASNTLTVTARSTSFNTAGSGLGAVTTFTDDLYARGKKIGRDQVTCIATGPGSFLECYATDLLPKGQVESTGPFDPVHQTHVTVGISGGTGAYRAARGTIDINVLSQTRSSYVYHFDN
jgi:hypothetical protein